MAVELRPRDRRYASGSAAVVVVVEGAAAEMETDTAFGGVCRVEDDEATVAAPAAVPADALLVAVVVAVVIGL